MLESYLSAFLVTFIISGSAALLCFCVVRDALIKKMVHNSDPEPDIREP